MADVQSNIQVSIDTTQALASIKNLQRQISAFHSSMAKGGAAANAVSAQMQQTLLNSINAGGKFSAQIRTIKTTTESFTDSLQKNKFSIGEYFRYAGGASKTFGRLFKTEFDTINKVARENVKDLQTQYIRLGRDASGAMKSIAVRPLALDMNDLGTKTQIAAQKQALLNQLLKQGSTNLLNFGKNTQWAGRQLMVGFTLPLMAVGSAAAKTFMDMETQAIRFKKVYGDLFTPQAESQKALKEIEDLGREFTKYGIAVSSTVGLAAEAAAAGFQGVDLQRQTAAATKLSILGQVESQKALETTIALQNAFSMSSADLATNIDFLNAVENQTVLSLDDMSTAIPKAAPVVQQLGGDVKDLAFLMTAMKEGGINASEGANALKSGLASLINPTGKANDMLLSFGINAKKIVEDNRGDLKKTVIEFATALNQLDPLNRAQTIEQMFGKFQFARLSTLFSNVTKEGTQAARVLDLAGASIQDLAAMSEKELGMTSESAMNKFKGAVESLKLSLVPLGEEFLKAVTPVAEFVTKLLDKFNGLSDNTKKVIVTLTAIIGGLGPVFLMTFGLLANGLANIIKGFTVVKSLFNKTGQETGTLGTATRYMTEEQRNAAAVAASLDQVHTKLKQTFTSEAAAVNLLTQAYQRAVAAQAVFMPVAAPMGRGAVGRVPTATGRAKGKPAIVGGTGNKDSELALLMPGETVIPTKMSQKYGGIINDMIADRVPGYEFGKTGSGDNQISIYPEYAMRLQDARENMGQRSGATGVPNVLAPLALRVGEARGIAPTQRQIDAGKFDGIFDEYQDVTTQFVDKVNSEYNDTFKDIKDENERMQKAWSSAGKHVEKQVDSIESTTDRSVVRKVFALDEDEYGTIPTDSREAGGTTPNRARRGAFRSRATKFRSYTDIRGGAKRLFSRRTGVPSESLQMGHVFGPRTVPIETLEADPRKTASVASARKVLDRGKKDGAEYAKGVDSTVKDPYELSQDRSSPHRRAAPDGKADGTAYVEARDEAIEKAEKKTQSGRSRRVATRGQGPASSGSGTQAGSTFIATGGALTEKEKREERRKRRAASRRQGPAAIGATPLPGMRILPIVSPLTEKEQRREERRAARKQFLNKAKVSGSKFGTRLAGGTAILGANMALSAAPDFAGKDVIQGTMTGASLGMLFGPWGIAAGAAIGLVTTALGNLIEKQKEHKAMTEAMFKSSSSVAEFFGNAVVNTTMEVGRLNSAIITASGSTENLGTNFGYTNEELQRFSDLVASLPQGDPLKDILVGLESVTDPEEIKRIIENFVTTQVAVGQTLPEQAQKIYDLILAQSGNQSMVGQSFYNFKTQSEAVSATLKNASTNSVNLGNSLIELLGAASNTSDLVKIQSIIDGIGASGISAAEGLNAMYYAYLRIGNQGAASSLQNLRRIQGLTLAEINDLMQSATDGFRYEIGKDTTRKEILKSLDEFKKIRKEEEDLVPKTRPYQSLTEEKTSSVKKEIDLLKKRKKIIDDQIKKEKQITDELKKQNDYRDRQLKIDKDIVEAKISGDYIQAAILLQEKASNTEEFNKDKQISDLQKRSDALQQQIEERQSVSDAMVAAAQATTNAVVTGSENIVDAVNRIQPGGFTNKDGDGSFRDPLTIDSDKASIKSYIESEKPSAGITNQGASAGTVSVSQIDAAKAWNESWLEKTANAMNPSLKTEMELLEDYVRTYLRFAPNEKHLFVEIKGSDDLTYRFKVAKEKGKNGFIRVGEPIKKATGGYIENFMGGGNVRGAGTGTSDSIPAMLSNGEYVIKADSVRKYGVGTFDALNTQKFKEGGIVDKPIPSMSSLDPNKKFKTVEPKTPSFWNTITTGANWKALLGGQNQGTGPIFEGMQKGIFSLLLGGNAYSRYNSGESMAGGEYVSAAANVLLARIAGPQGNALMRSFVEQFGVMKGIPNLGHILQKGSLPFLGAAGSKIATKTGTAAMIGAAKPFVESKVSATLTDLKPKIVRVAGDEDPFAKAVMEDWIEYQGKKLPVYSGGPFGHQRIVYQGGTDDFSELATSGRVSQVIPTTPEGILNFLLQQRPKDKQLIAMRDSFDSGDIGASEIQFLTKMIASTSFGQKSFNTRGLVSELPQEYLDLIKSKDLSLGYNFASQRVDQLPTGTLDELLALKQSIDDQWTRIREMTVGTGVRLPVSYPGKTNDLGLLPNTDTRGLTTFISSMLGDKAAKTTVDQKTALYGPYLDKIVTTYADNFALYKGKDSDVDLSQIPMIRELNYGIQYDKNGNIVAPNAGMPIKEAIKAGEHKDGLSRVTEHWTMWDSVRAGAFHGNSSWKESDTTIVTTLKNLLKTSEFESIASFDAWRTAAFGKQHTVLRPDTSVITAIRTKEAYMKALKERGLYKDGDPLKIVTESPETKEIFYLKKPEYNDSELDEIVSLFEAERGYLPEISRISPADRSAREIEKGEGVFQDTGSYDLGAQRYSVDRVLKMYAIRKAQQQIGIDTRYGQMLEGANQTIAPNLVKAISNKTGTSELGLHSHTSLAKAEQWGDDTNPFLTLIQEGGVKSKDGALAAILMHGYFGKFSSEAYKASYSRTLDERVAKLVGEWARASVAYRSGDTSIKPIDFDELNIILKKMKEADDEEKFFGATGGFVDKGRLKVPKFAMGGLIRGPGSGTSDSIRASLGYAGGGSIRVSNGEYIVKAKSVRGYGVDAMNAVNNGTATIGTNSGGTVYNINMPITSNNANPEGVANEVMRRLKLEISKNNKSNKVGL
jgi:TP901 family phage tail tape measure protein